MIINGKKIKAVIFDLDGTLLDSTSVWEEIDKEFFAMHNMEVPADYSKKIAHMGLNDAAIFTKAEYGFKESIEEIMQVWKDMSVSIYVHDVNFKANALNLLNKYKEEGLILNVATANSAVFYEPCLKRLGVYDYFKVIADVDIVKSGKQNSKIYDYIANKLNLKPEEIAVFEDVATCLKTAYEANYNTVAVYDKHSVKDDKEKKKYSYIYVNDFGELL